MKNYEDSLILEVTEVHSRQLRSAQYRCKDAFRKKGPSEIRTFDRILHEEAALKVSAVFLDHDIPCLGFTLTERFHINIRKDRLDELGLQPGPWLHTFKQALFGRLSPETVIEAALVGNERKKRFRLGDLAGKIALITPGQKIGYIVDVGYTPASAEKIVTFVKNADHLFIEAAFLNQHGKIAGEKNHLTARQAGTIAGRAQVKQFTPFHFSPRYVGQEHLLRQEALEAYRIFELEGRKTASCR